MSPDQNNEAGVGNTGSSAMSELEVHCEQALKAFVSAVLAAEELGRLTTHSPYKRMFTSCPLSCT